MGEGPRQLFPQLAECVCMQPYRLRLRSQALPGTSLQHALLWRLRDVCTAPSIARRGGGTLATPASIEIAWSARLDEANDALRLPCTLPLRLGLGSWQRRDAAREDFAEAARRSRLVAGGGLGHALLASRLLPLLNRSDYVRVALQSSGARFNVGVEDLARDLGTSLPAVAG